MKKSLKEELKTSMMVNLAQMINQFNDALAGRSYEGDFEKNFLLPVDPNGEVRQGDRRRGAFLDDVVIREDRFEELCDFMAEVASKKVSKLACEMMEEIDG